MLACSFQYGLIRVRPPPSSIDPSVISNVSFDKKSAIYTYKYDLHSGSDSQIPIKSFILQISQEPASIQSPVHWLSDFINLSGLPLHIHWGSVHSSKYKSVDIVPGRHLSGFSFQSTQPPGLVLYNVEGRTGVPSSSPPPIGSLDDEPEPNCPDWDFESPKFKTIITGITLGPLAPNTASVLIRLRDGTGIRPFAPISPINPTGQVGVLVLASRTFDPSQILISSIKFGPNEAAPISSKLIPTRDDDNRETEREEWERLVQGLGDGHEHDLDRDPTKSNLLLVFDLASLGITCVLDKAVFLTGQTQAGTSIIGAASTRLTGCDIHHPGKRRPKADLSVSNANLKNAEDGTFKNQRTQSMKSQDPSESRRYKIKSI